MFNRNLKTTPGIDINSVLKEFDSHYREAVQAEHEDLIVREDKLRVSSFPYCGLRHLYRKLTSVPQKTNFGATFYTGVGTVTHEAIQRWLGHSKRMLGNWKCSAKKCKGKREFSFRNTCPICGSEMLYEEFEVNALTHISGHLDGIYKARNGKFYLIDYKTSSVRVISTNWKTKMLPYKYNVFQITAYAALIEQEYAIEISGWILYYLSRDNPLYISKPTGGVITSLEKKNYLRRMQVWARHYEHVMVRTKEFKDIKLLVEEKPCQDMKGYEDVYKAYDVCPLAKGGVCFERSLLRSKLLTAWEEREENWQIKRRPKYLENCKNVDIP